MGAKFVALATPTATVNTNGISCKIDADCTGAVTYGVNKTARAAITVAADKAKYCCNIIGLTKAASGTTAETTQAKTLFTSYKNSVGVVLEIGTYTKYCVSDYPATITSYTVAGQTSYNGYDAKTGLLKYAKINGAFEAKTYCDGGAQALALATVAAAAVSVSMV